MSVIVHKERGTNVVKLADLVKARVAELEARNPAGAQFILVYDQSDDVRRELTDLWKRAAVSAAVIFVVLLAFLRSWSTTVVGFSTIVFST